MKTINFRAYKGYPMLQLINHKDRTINFVDTTVPEIGDVMEMFTQNLDPEGQTLVRTEPIKEIIESRKPRGQHKDKEAVFYSVRYE